MSTTPNVTVLVPAKNEERDIERCLRAILAQDYSHDRMEIVLVDGGSTDGTATIARAVLVESDVDWRVLDNPVGTTPSNLNAGLSIASGDLVCRVDARSIISTDYVTRCVELLQEPRFVVVGGRQVAVAREGSGLMARSIARGLNNRWATGLARYRRGAKSGGTDTVYLGAMRLAELRRVGGWDECFETNQDFDLNRRLARHGIVWFDDRLSVQYLPRESFRDLWRQYVRFGRWKTRYWVTRREAPRPRQYALLVGPVVVVLFMLGLLRRHPGMTAATVIAGAVALDITGVEEPASPAIRIGGVIASVTVAAGWWWGVISGWIRS